jgi:hypothetical protein
MTPTRLPVLLHSLKSAAADFAKAQIRQAATALIAVMRTHR